MSLVQVRPAALTKLFLLLLIIQFQLHIKLKIIAYLGYCVPNHFAILFDLVFIFVQDIDLKTVNQFKKKIFYVKKDDKKRVCRWTIRCSCGSIFYVPAVPLQDHPNRIKCHRMQLPILSLQYPLQQESLIIPR